MNEAEPALSLGDRVILTQMAHLAGLEYCTFSGNGAIAELLRLQGRPQHADLLNEYAEACLRPDLDAFSLTKLLHFDLAEVDPVLVGPGSIDRRVAVTVRTPPLASLSQAERAAYAQQARFPPLVRVLLNQNAASLALTTNNSKGDKSGSAVVSAGASAAAVSGFAPLPPTVAGAVIEGGFAQLAPLAAHCVQLYASRSPADWVGHLSLAAPTVLVVPASRADFVALEAQGYVAAFQAVGAKVFPHADSSTGLSTRTNANASTSASEGDIAVNEAGDVREWVLAHFARDLASAALAPGGLTSRQTVLLTSSSLTSSAPLANPSPVAAGACADPYALSAAFPLLTVAAASPLVAFASAASGDLRSPIVEAEKGITITMPAVKPPSSGNSAESSASAASSTESKGWFQVTLPSYPPSSPLLAPLRADRFQTALSLPALAATALSLSTRAHRSRVPAPGSAAARDLTADLDGVWRVVDGGRAATVSQEGGVTTVTKDLTANHNANITASSSVTGDLNAYLFPNASANVNTGSQIGRAHV